LVKASKQLVTGGFRLRINARQDLAQNAPHSMKLVNKVKDDRDAFVVDAELLQVVDQMSSGEIDLGKVLGGVDPVGCEPARVNPLVSTLASIRACRTNSRNSIVMPPWLAAGCRRPAIGRRISRARDRAFQAASP